MLRLAPVSASVLCLSLLPVLAEDAPPDWSLEEGRSVGLCSPDVLVCAVLKDDTMTPMSECGARRESAVRTLAGDCYDAD